MRLDNPIPALAAALYSACHVDLADIEYETVDYATVDRTKPMGMWPKVQARRRPGEQDVEVYAMFAQTWSSTALGFDRMGGHAMTPAYTVVINRRGTREFCVYFDGRFAYRIEKPNGTFFEDIEGRRMVPVRDHAVYLVSDVVGQNGVAPWEVRFGDERSPEQTVHFEAHDHTRAVTRFCAEVMKRALDHTIGAAYASIGVAGRERSRWGWTKVENEHPIDGLLLSRHPQLDARELVNGQVSAD